MVDFELRLLSLSSYKRLKTRRDHEVEGFTSDIRNLRQDIRKLERQLISVTADGDVELELLGIARNTGKKAGKLAGGLHDLKVATSST